METMIEVEDDWLQIVYVYNILKAVKTTWYLESRVGRLVLPWPGLKKRVSSRSEEWSHFSVNVSRDFRCTRGMFCCCFQELHISWSFMLWIPTSRKFLLEQHVPCLIPTSNKHHGAGPNGRNAGVYSTTKLFGCLARRDFQVVDPWQKNGNCNWSTGCLTHLGPDPGKTGDWSKKMMKQIDLSSSLYILIKTITCESNFFCPILLYGILVLRTKPNWTNLLRWAPEFDLSTNTNMRKFDHKHIELLFIPFNKIPTKQHTMYMDVYGCI